MNDVLKENMKGQTLRIDSTCVAVRSSARVLLEASLKVFFKSWVSFDKIDASCASSFPIESVSWWPLVNGLISVTGSRSMALTDN